MSAALSQPPRKTWTRREIEALEAAGLLAGTRLELIEGEIFDRMGQNPAHASAVCRLVMALASIFGLDRVRTQLPVEPAEAEASRSLPEPDVAVTRETEPAYRRRHPRAADVVLIAEVADSTVDYDVKRKGRLYARAGFPEYVVLDLTERELMVFTAPREGVYTEMRILRPGDVFKPMNTPDSGIPVAELFGESAGQA
jgi:Uma2 family endonuclease